VAPKQVSRQKIDAQNPVRPPLDRWERPLGSLRVSITDRCDLRCRYCMPEPDYRWLPRADILTFEEIVRLVDVFTDLGASRVRLTGGEPLLRRGVEGLVEALANRPGIRDLAMTTNGVRLRSAVPGLRSAGLHRLTVSFDTLRPERFHRITGRDVLGEVRRGIEAASEAGFRRLKLNALVVRGVNDDEPADLIAFGKSVGAEVRFIEYMDVGGATRWSPDRVFPLPEILSRLKERFGSVTALPENAVSPSRGFRLPDGTRFGIIPSTTAPFCGTCDRSRLTADGRWLSCLYAVDGPDLRGYLRKGASREMIRMLIADTWRQRRDRGAEDRLRVRDRGPMFQVTELRRDPHLEMHTRGG
jgi:cyclic pyranopterin phosphate synthase